MVKLVENIISTHMRLDNFSIREITVNWGRLSLPPKAEAASL